MTASALQTVEAFEVRTSDDDGFHYIYDTAAMTKVAGPYPLKKTANRRARQLCEQFTTDKAEVAACVADAMGSDEPLEPRELETFEAADLEEELAEPAPKLSLGELYALELERQAAEDDRECPAGPGEEEEEEEEPAAEEEEATPHAPAERRAFQLIEPAAIVTREDWLIAATVRIRPVLESMASLDLPAVRVTCGWPSKGGAGGAKRVVGQCWNPEASSDNHAEVFISPMEADPQTVLAILTHELIHACLPKGTGHKAPFVKAAKAVGFATPVTQLTMPDELLAWLVPMVEGLPAYPHAAIDPRGAEGEKKKQTTRQLKVECPDCGYTLRGTKKWLSVALPMCGVCKVEMVCEDLDDGDAPEGEGDE